MKFSIIIPCLNQIELLKDCLKSISEQSFDSYEVIVVDGDSTDGTREFLKSVQGLVKSISEKDKGVYHAMNKGIELAEGDWLYFMGVDDRFNDIDVLKNINIATTKNIKLIAGNVLYQFKRKDTFFVKRNKGLVKPEWNRKLWLRNTMHHQGLFYNRLIFNNELFNAKYKILGDYALNLKLWQQRVPILLTDEIIAKCGTQGLSKKYNWNLYREEINLKNEVSSIVFKPIFTVIALIKYSIKNLF